MPQQVVEVDALSRVGRGGAGNYVSSKQAAEASKDLEAQQLRAINSAPSPAPSPGSARAGRGGAGNFADATQAAQSQGRLADETSAAVASRWKTHPQPHRAGWLGRGGAGNFNAKQAAETERRQQQQQQEKGKAAELDRMILEAVEGALRPPQRAHQHQGKEEEEP